MKYATMSGHEFEVEDERRDAVAFLERMQKMLEDPKVTENDMIALGYGSENPFLDHAMFPGRGAVTPRVFEDPAYHVMADLIARKRLAQDRVDPETLAAEYTITVPEAAARLGIHESAVRQAIASRKLASWVKDGRHFLHPRSLASYQLGTRGPKPTSTRPRAGSPVSIRFGNAPGVSFRTKHDGIVAESQKVGQHATEMTVGAWHQIAVMSGAGPEARMLILEPADEENEITNAGFFVRGKFRIAKRLNNLRIANEAWKAWGK